jgi:hypothetical protein
MSYTATLASADTIMPTDITNSSSPSLSADRAKRRSRPLTVTQEAVFFGVAIVVAVLLQAVVLLKFGGIIDI